MELKTAQELRAMAAVAGVSIASQMSFECSGKAKNGLCKHEFLQDKEVSTDAVDFAISEMVAAGFSVELIEDHKSSVFNAYLIKW